MDLVVAAGLVDGGGAVFDVGAALRLGVGADSEHGRAGLDDLGLAPDLGGAAATAEHSAALLVALRREQVPLRRVDRVAVEVVEENGEHGAAFDIDAAAALPQNMATFCVAPWCSVGTMTQTSVLLVLHVPSATQNDVCASGAQPSSAYTRKSAQSARIRPAAISAALSSCRRTWKSVRSAALAAVCSIWKTAPCGNPSRP